MITGFCGHNTVIKIDSVNRYIIISPGYPYLYEANLDYVWNIYNTNGKSLSVSFVDVDIEEDPYCIYDYVDVIEVNATETIIKDYILYIILTVHCYQCI